MDAESAQWKSSSTSTTGPAAASAPLSARDHVGVFPQRDGRVFVGFADGFSFLLTSCASLDDLNHRLPAPLPMNRFRPNIVVSGGEAFEEDRWTRISIDGIAFAVVKPCARCVITTVDQRTGEASHEPLRTLATFRNVAGRGVMFGQNLIHEQSGVLHVGAEVAVLE